MVRPPQKPNDAPQNPSVFDDCSSSSFHSVTGETCTAKTASVLPAFQVLPASFKPSGAPFLEAMRVSSLHHWVMLAGRSSPLRRPLSAGSQRVVHLAELRGHR
jgi:hypothetical protein